MHERKDLLRMWLRGKNIHVADIKYALDWYDSEIEAGRSPDDEAVKIKAEEGHARAISASTITKSASSPIIVNVPDIKLKRFIIGSLIGTSIALVVLEGIKWVLPMIQSQLLLVG